MLVRGMSRWVERRSWLATSAIVMCACCGAPRPRNAAPPSDGRALVVAPIDAGPLDAPVTPIARGEAVVAILTREGGYYPGIVRPSDPGVLVRRCLDGPDAVRPLVAGFLVFALGLPYDTSARVTLLESSPHVPEALAACIASTLRGLSSYDGAPTIPGLIAYVSLR
jgi:hypothetical protein